MINIEIEIGDKKIKLTIDEAVELKRELDELLSADDYYPIVPYNPQPHRDPYWIWTTKKNTSNWDKTITDGTWEGMKVNDDFWIDLDPKVKDILEKDFWLMI